MTGSIGTWLGAGALAAALASSGVALAQTAPQTTPQTGPRTGAEAAEMRRQLEDMRRQMREMQQTYERQIQTLENRINSVETKAASQTAPAAGPAPRAATGPAARDPGNFQIGFSTTLTGGGSSVSNDVLQNLQRGHHDPDKNGFTLQSAELALGGAVDPYFDARATISLKIDADGETELELEEAYFRTRSLPYGLQVKGGQYFTEFGRHNALHQHAWDFVDMPVILSRLFGPDGLRSQGARVGWLTPLPWYSELIVGMQNAKGETAASFLNVEGEEVGGYTLANRQQRSFGDLLHTARWLNGVDVGRNTSVNLGVSGAFGPNSSGRNNDTVILGADLYAKWQPAQTERGFPFVSFLAEALWRRYEAGDDRVVTLDPDTGEVVAIDGTGRERLKDWGLFAQGLWGFAPGWVAGTRFEYADASGGLESKAADPTRDRRFRFSPNITWYPTEFSKVRLQYNRDWAQHLRGTEDDGSADTVWLQVEFALGSHFAHTF